MYAHHMQGTCNVTIQMVACLYIRTYDIVHIPMGGHVYTLHVRICCHFSFLAVPAHFVMCDMLKGSVERIVRSSFLLRLIDRLRLLTLIVVHKDISYAVDTQVSVTNAYTI